MLTFLMLAFACYVLALYFYVKTYHPRKVYNRPGYWMALRWARWFVWQALRGRVDVRRQSGGLIWEAWPDSERWRNTSHFPFALLWHAIMGARFRMDQTDYMTAMEIWPNDNE